MDELAANLLHDGRSISCGSTSIRDMINFSLADFLFTYRLLIQECDIAIAKENQPIDADDAAKYTRAIKHIAAELQGVSSPEIQRRLQSCLDLIYHPDATNSVVAYELGTVIHLFQDQAQFEGFFHYSLEDASAIRSNKADWVVTQKAFTNAGREITGALDCLALGHHEGAIFYMIRLAEIALRALATERSVQLKKDKPIEYAQWQEVITAVETTTKSIGLSMSPGKAKDEALAFYGSAVADLYVLKDKFRNQVMHVRDKSFDRGAALECIQTTKRLTTNLAARITSRTKTEIKWKS